MKSWKTILHLNHDKENMTSRPIEIKSGTYKGDSLSPLVFCLALARLSSLLKKSGYGYNIPNGGISHLFYMGDVYINVKNDDEQTGLLRTIESFSEDIGMDFGLDKCVKVPFKRGWLADSSNIELDVNTVTKGLGKEGTYQYLGVSEEGIQNSQMKRKIRKEYYRRIRMVNYSFNIIAL